MALLLSILFPLYKRLYNPLIPAVSATPEEGPTRLSSVPVTTEEAPEETPAQDSSVATVTPEEAPEEAPAQVSSVAPITPKETTIPLYSESPSS